LEKKSPRGNENVLEISTRRLAINTEFLLAWSHCSDLFRRKNFIMLLISPQKYTRQIDIFIPSPIIFQFKIQL
jgi:hypothetical protein